jgi:uncharacterized phage infection (PIP) family protein YhgE
MEDKIYELIVKMQMNMNEMNQKLNSIEEINKRIEKMNDGIKRIDEMNDGIRRIEETVNRIEIAQTEDIVGILKVTKKKMDIEIDHINEELSDLKKRVFKLEKRMEN